MDFVDGAFQMRQSGYRDTTDDKEEKTDSTKTHGDNNMVIEENFVEK